MIDISVILHITSTDDNCGYHTRTFVKNMYTPYSGKIRYRIYIVLKFDIFQWNIKFCQSFKSVHEAVDYKQTSNPKITNSPNQSATMFSYHVLSLKYSIKLHLVSIHMLHVKLENWTSQLLMCRLGQCNWSLSSWFHSVQSARPVIN